MADYVMRHRLDAEADIFGLCQSRDANGVAYQPKLRAEW
jgi:hypothetical protein